MEPVVRYKSQGPALEEPLARKTHQAPTTTTTTTTPLRRHPLESHPLLRRLRILLELAATQGRAVARHLEARPQVVVEQATTHLGEATRVLVVATHHLVEVVLQGAP
jgi:hypothetical protein